MLYQKDIEAIRRHHEKTHGELVWDTGGVLEHEAVVVTRGIHDHDADLIWGLGLGRR